MDTTTLVTTVQSVGGEFYVLLFNILITALAALGTWVTWELKKFIAAKTGVTLSDAQVAKVEDYYAQAIAYAEEYGTNWLKTSGSKLPSVQKLDAAVKYVRNVYPDLDKTTAEIERDLLARLGASRG